MIGGWVTGAQALLGLGAGSILGGAVMYGWMSVREAVVVAGAVRAERNEQVSLCNADKREMAAGIADQVSDGVRIALEAAAHEGPTPSEQVEINALCKRSASCRDRGEMP